MKTHVITYHDIQGLHGEQQTDVTFEARGSVRHPTASVKTLVCGFSQLILMSYPQSP